MATTNVEEVDDEADQDPVATSAGGLPGADLDVDSGDTYGDVPEPDDEAAPAAEPAAEPANDADDDLE